MIHKLETAYCYLTVIESRLVLVEIRESKLNDAGEESGVSMKKKLTYVLFKNLGSQHMKTIRNIILNKNENNAIGIYRL